MNNRNFDSLKNLKAPDLWIENAINIPKIAAKPKAVVFFKFSRYIAAAACVVLVCAVSILVYMTLDKDIVPIDKNFSTTEKVSTDENNAGANDPQNGYSDNSGNDNHNDNTGNNQDSSNNTGSENNPQQNGNSQKPDTGNDENSNPTQPPESGNTPPVEPPTEDPEHPADGEVPTPSVPSDPYDPPTEPPTTDDPWEPPYDDPYEPPPTSPPPSTPGYPDPGAPPGEGCAPINGDCSGYTDINNLSGSYRVYCIVTDPSGNQMGSKEWFIKEHQATIYEQVGTTIYFAYSVMGTYTIYETGTYTCNFYNENGQKLYTDVIYIVK